MEKWFWIIVLFLLMDLIIFVIDCIFYRVFKDFKVMIKGILSIWFGFCGFREYFCRNENFVINVYFCLKGLDCYIKKEILVIYYFGFRCMVWYCLNCNWFYICILDGWWNVVGICLICVIGNWVY